MYSSQTSLFGIVPFPCVNVNSALVSDPVARNPWKALVKLDVKATDTNL